MTPAPCCRRRPRPLPDPGNLRAGGGLHAGQPRSGHLAGGYGSSGGFISNTLGLTTPAAEIDNSAAFNPIVFDEGAAAGEENSGTDTSNLLFDPTISVDESAPAAAETPADTGSESGAAADNGAATDTATTDCSKHGSTSQTGETFLRPYNVMRIKNAHDRYIFITGGVVSSLGKGLASAALASLLQARGFSVRLRKLDPYLNVDPGTMSPYQHGEVYVTDDGAETDLDLGHYERFTGVSALQSDNVTTGRIYPTSSPRSGRANTSAQPCRSSRTSPTPSRISRLPISTARTS